MIDLVQRKRRVSIKHGKKENCDYCGNEFKVQTNSGYGFIDCNIILCCGGWHAEKAINESFGMVAHCTLCNMIVEWKAERCHPNSYRWWHQTCPKHHPERYMVRLGGLPWQATTDITVQEELLLRVGEIYNNPFHHLLASRSAELDSHKAVAWEELYDDNIIEAFKANKEGFVLAPSTREGAPARRVITHTGVEKV